MKTNALDFIRETENANCRLDMIVQLYKSFVQSSDQYKEQSKAALEHHIKEAENILDKLFPKSKKVQTLWLSAKPIKTKS